jgi:cytochrome c oxidase cbb3-type subunit I/II
MLFYVVPIYWAGVTQGLMWKQFTPEGTCSTELPGNRAADPAHARMRAIGGSLYLLGVILMVVNLIKTASQGTFGRDRGPGARALDALAEDAHEPTPTTAGWSANP